MRPDERELDEEIRGHLALAIQERVERGKDPEAARRAALEEFGYLPHVRESMRAVWYSRWFDAAVAFAQDMRVGLRSLLRTRGLAATVVVTLALGIGANAAIFRLVDQVLLRTLPVRAPHELVMLHQEGEHNGNNLGSRMHSYPFYQDLQTKAEPLAEVLCRRLQPAT